MIPIWAILPLMALMGFGLGLASPSRDLLIRQVIQKSLGTSSFGRVYGIVYSGMDVGQVLAPLLFGFFLDKGVLVALWIGIALFQGLAIVSALKAGKTMGTLTP